MSAIASVLVLSWILSVAATGAVRGIAGALKLFDSAQSPRKVHRGRVPRLGGIGIVTGISGALALGLLVPHVRAAIVADRVRLAGLLVACTGVVLLGLYDDVRGARARHKLAVQLVAAGLLYAVGFRIEQVENPFGPDIPLGASSIPVTLLWIVGISNAINLIDGLDGLAGGICVAAAVAVLYIGWSDADVPAMVIAAAVIGSVVGFLFYNVTPASIFMGDTGSLFLGMLLAALAVRPRAPAAGAIPLVAMIVALGIPIADTLLAILRRTVKGVPVFSPDREHLHHRLLDLGLSQRQAVVTLWGGAAALAAAGVHIACGSRGRPVTVTVVAAAIVVALGSLGMFTFALPSQTSRRRRNRELFHAVRLASRRIRVATGMPEIREELARAAPRLRVRSLRLRTGDSGATQRDWTAETDTGTRTRYALDATRPELGALEVAWADGKNGGDRDVEIAFELLFQEVASAARRIQPRTGPRPSLVNGLRWTAWIGIPSARQGPRGHRNRPPSTPEA